FFASGGIWPEDCLLIAQSGVEGRQDMDDLEVRSPEGFPSAIQIGSSLCKSGAVPDWLNAWLAG
ncbi:MAG: hypothetical protein HQL32_12255, partial [Planctomycetes bacterium]|nr:hypothetical protein [Planctomycetota bacterium]